MFCTGKPARHWTAVVPLLMSLAGLALIWGYVLTGGGRQADEGAAARLWQLLMLGQILIIAVFAVTWLPRSARSAFVILGLQGLAILANLASLWRLER